MGATIAPLGRSVPRRHRRVTRKHVQHRLLGGPHRHVPVAPGREAQRPPRVIGVPWHARMAISRPSRHPQEPNRIGSFHLIRASSARWYVITRTRVAISVLLEYDMHSTPLSIMSAKVINRSSRHPEDRVFPQNDCGTNNTGISFDPRRGVFFISRNCLFPNLSRAAPLRTIQPFNQD